VAVQDILRNAPEKVTPDLARAERGFRLFEEHGHQFRQFGTGLYRVPSCSGEVFYTVDYLDETCTCKDFEFHGGPCKHVYAIGVSRAKRRGATLRSLQALEEQLADELMDDEERQEVRDRVRALRRRLGR
jgi:hypothetical protein